MELHGRKLTFGDMEQYSTIKGINNQLDNIFSTQKKLKEHCAKIGIVQECMYYLRNMRGISKEMRNASHPENKRYYSGLKKQEKTKFMNRIATTLVVE